MHWRLWAHWWKIGGLERSIGIPRFTGYSFGEGLWWWRVAKKEPPRGNLANKGMFMSPLELRTEERRTSECDGWRGMTAKANSGQGGFKYEREDD